MFCVSDVAGSSPIARVWVIDGGKAFDLTGGEDIPC